MVKKIDRACANNKLENHVILWLNEQGREYDNGAEGAFNDLMQGGCASGIVGHLIYYKDTLRFYKTHRDTIAEYLKEMMGGTGINNPSELFSNWDKDDPLALDDHNQNLLAWFGFEEAAVCVARCAGIDY